jgi:hypothetical protein
LVVDQAAVAAYHAAIEWGVTVSDRGMTIFNSHWERSEDWYRLPEISWDDLERNQKFIEALSPDGVRNGLLDELAIETYPFDHPLLRVDEALVERLGIWRKHALEYAPRAEGLDAELQILFAQLFVLRAVEDRILAPELPALSTVLRGHGVARDALASLYSAAQARIEPSLFAMLPPPAIAADILAGLIQDLYWARHLPGRKVRYNFAWLDADVLGNAYEKYVSTEAIERAPHQQVDIFREQQRTIEERSVRKAGGIYYTPAYLVRALTAEAIDNAMGGETNGWAPMHPTPPSITAPLTTVGMEEASQTQDGPDGDGFRLPFIADFACGSGAFLVAAADHLLRKLRAVEPTRAWAHELIAGQHIVGIDVDERAVTITKLNLWIRLTAEPESLPLPALDDVIIHGDSLSDEPWKQLPPGFDVVVGNPPFIKTQGAPDRPDLPERFRTAVGRFDYAYLFAERAATKLRRQGIFSLVVPNRLFRNRDAGAIRDLVSALTDLLVIIDFGSEEVFKGTSSYIGTITARRRSETDPERQLVRVVRVASAKEKFLGAMLTRAIRTEGEVRNDVLYAYDAAHPHGPSPWLLLSPRDQLRRVRLSERSKLLSELALVRQGIRTGANDLFIVAAEALAEDFVRIRNALGESAVVETDILRPVVFGSAIRRYEAVQADRYLIYPYRRGVLLEEVEFRERYPAAWKYLERYRDFLAERASLTKTGRWYELIRQRESDWLDRPKLVIRDLATESSFAIDDLGGTYLIGGTAVMPQDPAWLWPLLAYLNTRLVSEYLRQSTPAFRGGFQKFEPRHLEGIPIPRRLLRDPDLRQELEDAAWVVVRAQSAGDEEARSHAEARIESAVRTIVDSPITESDLDVEDSELGGFRTIGESEDV